MEFPEDIRNPSTGIGGFFFDKSFLRSEFGSAAVAWADDELMPILNIYSDEENIEFDNYGNPITKPSGFVSIPFKMWEIINNRKDYRFIDGNLYHLFETSTSSNVDETGFGGSFDDMINEEWTKVSMEKSQHSFDVFDLTVTFGELTELEENVINKAVNTVLMLVLDIALFIPWIFCELLKRIAKLAWGESNTVDSIERIQNELFSSENWDIPLPLIYTDIRSREDGYKKYTRIPSLIGIFSATLKDALYTDSSTPTKYELGILNELERVINKTRDDSNLTDDNELTKSTYYNMASELLNDPIRKYLIADKVGILALFLPSNEPRIACSAFVRGINKTTDLKISSVKSYVIGNLKTNINYFNTNIENYEVPKNWSDYEGKTYSINNRGEVNG